jgi:hypothetical protein
MIPVTRPPLNLIPTRINLTRWHNALALSVCRVVPLLAQGRKSAPQSAGPIRVTVRLPRRYAFRHVQITVVSASCHRRFGVAGFAAEAVTSADESRLLPFTPRHADEAALDLVAPTAKSCVHRGPRAKLLR